MIGIVYSQATGRIRWILYPDSDAELDGLNPGKGEAVYLSKSDQAQDEQGQPLLQVLQDELNAVTGLNPDKATDLYVVVDAVTGDVQGCVVADPLCDDKLDGRVLIKDDQADSRTGQKLDPAELVKLEPGTVTDQKPDETKWIKPVVILDPPKPVDGIVDADAETKP